MHLLLVSQTKLLRALSELTRFSGGVNDSAPELSTVGLFSSAAVGIRGVASEGISDLVGAGVAAAAAEAAGLVAVSAETSEGAGSPTDCA